MLKPRPSSHKRAKPSPLLSDTQVSELTHLSLSYTAPYGEVQRARIVLHSHHHPEWSNTQIARTVGCSIATVRRWSARWIVQGTLDPLRRSGAPRHFTPLVRAQITALACSNPSTHDKAFKRWSGEKLAQVAIEQKIVETISASSIRHWLKEEKIKPWRYHSWQKSQDPQFVEKASLVLDLYEHAVELATQKEVVCCVDEKPSIQARWRVDTTLAAKPGQPMHVAYLYKRMGALQLFCALMVTTGLTLVDCYPGKTFSEFKQFLLKLFASNYCKDQKVLHLILNRTTQH